MGEFSYFIGTMTALRLLLSHPAALRFLRLAVPPLFSLFALPMAENKPWKAWSCYPVIPTRHLRWTLTVSPRFLGNLLCICSALRPRSDNGTRSIRYPCTALDLVKTKAPTKCVFRGSITQLLHLLSTLHTRNRFLICKTRFRLLTRLYRAGHFLPARFLLKVSAHWHSPLPTRLILAQYQSPLGGKEDPRDFLRRPFPTRAGRPEEDLALEH